MTQGKNHFEYLAQALLGQADNIEVSAEAGGIARIDPHRQSRAGIPEVIFAERKTVPATLEIAKHFLTAGEGRALISRARPALLERIKTELATVEVNGETRQVNSIVYPNANFVVLRLEGQAVVSTGGRVGVVSAGTSDIPRAEEAVAIATEMGCEVRTVYDVGVAGLHRLFHPLNMLLDWDADVLVAVAGMDGALPSVIAGMVDMPVIGLPTSVGYGAGGKGKAALLSMLQTCAPGLSVVNIDNGVGAGSTAALIANRMANLRLNKPPLLTEAQTSEKPALNQDSVSVLETNIDDMSAEAHGFLMEKLLAAGALDVYFVPLQMKKNRPAVMLGVIAKPEDEEKLARLILTESSSFGVRISHQHRYIADRTTREIATEFGPASVKAKIIEAKIVEWVPEYESVANLARQSGKPYRELYTLVQKLANDG